MTKTTREIVKIGKAWTVVSSCEFEASYCLPSRKAAEAHLATLIRAEAARLANEAATRTFRIEAAERYLATRKARAAAPVQFSLI